MKIGCLIRILLSFLALMGILGKLSDRPVETKCGWDRGVFWGECK